MSFFFICLVTKFKAIGHHSMVNSPSPSGDFSFSFTVQLTEWIGTIIHWLSLSHSLSFLWKRKKIWRGERKTFFFWSGLFSELEPNGPICWTEPKLPTLYTTIYSICVTSSKRRRGRENCIEGVTSREYPAGALRQWFNCQFPQGISFPPDLFLYFFFLLLYIFYFRYGICCWGMWLDDIVSASFSSSESVSHLSDLI